MKKIERQLMILKPTGGFSSCKNGIALRLHELGSTSTSAELSDACLKGDVYTAYLFLHSGEYSPAGQVTDGTLDATLPDIALSDIAGAALVRMDKQRPLFCLLSTGMDWTDTIARFLITHTPQTQEYPREPELSKPDPLPNTAQQLPPAPPTAPPPRIIHNEQSACDTCPHVQKQHPIDPFPAVFPGSKWVKISYPGPTGWWHYISGTIYKQGRTAKVLGVPGEYGMAPPIWLEGFGTYLRSAAGDARGYWLMFQDAETGEVMGMDLSPHGG